VSALDVSNNRIERTKSGVYINTGTLITVERNKFLNMKGPFPGGQFVQFGRVTGGGNRIKCNVGENILNQSYPEDAINIYDSHGTAADPLLVIGNKIRGGGPSGSGGGILLGDTDGSYLIASDNVVVDPGQYGIQIGGGHHNQLLNNLVFGKQQPFTNVGMAVWQGYPTIPCSNLTSSGNVVKWTNSSGAPNAAWNDGRCGTVAGWSSNTLNAAIDASIFDRPIAACQ
jgi:hypothetical protein